MIQRQHDENTCYLPPEWSPQSAIMITWPHADTIWAETLDESEKTFCTIAKHIATHQRVIISCVSTQEIERIRDKLKTYGVNMNAVHCYVAPCDDIWVRDHGPITVLQSNRPTLLDFEFNGWGNKYPHVNDNAITKTLHHAKAFADTPISSIPLVLEGGSIEVDGNGTLLTTTRCLLSGTRNPGLTKESLEVKLKSLLGVQQVLWLDHGYLSGDDTDSHIDTLARFVDPHTICYITCDDPSDEHFDELANMEDQLKTFKNAEGKPYRLIPLPWPKAKFADYDGRRLPLSYANFLITNHAVLAPTYDDPSDQAAIQALSICFPDKTIIPIPSLPIVQWYGSIHCMTMQLPLGVLS